MQGALERKSVSEMLQLGCTRVCGLNLGTGCEIPHAEALAGPKYDSMIDHQSAMCIRQFTRDSAKLDRQRP